MRAFRVDAIKVNTTNFYGGDSTLPIHTVNDINIAGYFNDTVIVGEHVVKSESETFAFGIHVLPDELQRVIRDTLSKIESYLQYCNS